MSATKTNQPSYERGAYYRSETKYLSRLCGGEQPGDQKDFFAALGYTNEASQLGMSAFELEVFGRVLTELGKQRRFIGDKTINRTWGENPATHSLQAICILEKLLHDHGKHYNGEDGPVDEIRRFTGLGLMIHDAGEVLGEPRALQGQSVNVPGGYEQTVLEAVLRKAIISVEQDQAAGDLTASRKTFSQEIQTMVEALGIQRRKDDALQSGEHPEAITEEQLASVLGETPEALSEQGQRVFDQYMGIWTMAEDPKALEKFDAKHISLPKNPAYVGQLIKSIEHNQGTRHITRFALKEMKQEKVGILNGTSPLNELGIGEDRLTRNLNYVESDLPRLYQAVENPFERSLATAQRDSIYATIISHINELLRAYDVTKDPDFDEIAVGREDKTSQGRLEQQERLITLYETAIADKDFVPELPSLGAHALKLERGATKQTPDVIVQAADIVGLRRAMTAEATGLAA